MMGTCSFDVHSTVAEIALSEQKALLFLDEGSMQVFLSVEYFASELHPSLPNIWSQKEFFI